MKRATAAGNQQIEGDDLKAQLDPVNASRSCRRLIRQFYDPRRRRCHITNCHRSLFIRANRLRRVL